MPASPRGPSVGVEAGREGEALLECTGGYNDAMETSGEHYRKLERMYAKAPINRFYEPELTVFDGRAELLVPIRSDFFHAADAVHGSVYFKALDDAAFFAVNSLVHDVLVLTVTFNLYLTRPIAEGVLRAEASVVHRSRSLFLADAKLTDSDANLVGMGSGSFTRSSIALSAEIGYA